MVLSTYETMIKEYEVRPIDNDDLEERARLLSVYKHSVIFEAEFLEFDYAVEWLKKEMKIENIDYNFYGKLDYDYGFFECFFHDEKAASAFSNIVPELFTQYPSGSVRRTNGAGNFVDKPGNAS